jgi:hypothetical protein
MGTDNIFQVDSPKEIFIHFKVFIGESFPCGLAIIFFREKPRRSEHDSMNGLRRLSLEPSLTLASRPIAKSAGGGNGSNSRAGDRNKKSELEALRSHHGTPKPDVGLFHAARRVYLTGGNPFEGLDASGYLRYAGLVSAGAFAIAYDPSLFSELLSRIPRTGGK